MSRVLLISGCHSSGTSAVGAVLTACGLPTLPDGLRPSETHPYGYFESKAVTDANSELLFAGGVTWFDTGAFAPPPPGAAARAPLQAIVDKLPEGDLFLKDPRICRTLPDWVEALERAGRKVSVLIPTRDPLEVATSLMVKHRFSVNHGLRLWRRFVTEAVEHSAALPRLIVPHDLAWRKLAGQVNNRLGFALKVKGAKPQIHEAPPLPLVRGYDPGLLDACRAVLEGIHANAGLRP